MYKRNEGMIPPSDAIVKQQDYRFFSALMEHITDNIYFKDASSRFIYISRNMAKHFGLDNPAEAIGKTDFDFFSHEHAREAFDTEQEIIRTGQPVIDLLEKETWPDGRVTWVSTTKMPFYNDEGAIVGTFGISRDVTERKQMQEEREDSQVHFQHRQKMEAIGQLSAGIAHEMNTPMQYLSDNVSFLATAFKKLMGVVETARSVIDPAVGDVDPQDMDHARKAFASARLDFITQEVPKALEQTVDGVRRISTIVSAMRSFSHPSPEAKRKVDLGEAIEMAVTLASSEWKYVANLELDIDPDLPEVLCVRDEINQVILNLIINAAHAIADTLEPGIREMGNIRVTARQDEQFAVVRISDDGIGISDDIINRIFDPFFTTKPVGQGTGQGLSLAHAIVVDKHQGKLTVDSTPGEGTVFTIKLPLGGFVENPTEIPD